MTTILPSRLAAVFALLMVFALFADAALAQSGSGTTPRYAQPGSGAARPAGSGAAPAGSGSAGGVAAAPVALGGYCAICLAEDRQWMAGRPEHAVDFDGKRYLFPSPEQQQKFQANPAQFAPALGGDDVVEYARSGRRVVGQLPLGAAYQGRFYFFASDANKQAFLAAPAQYANVDLALGGECVVCRLDMNQQVAGNPAITAVYQGVRYQFPGEQQRNQFLANPVRYASGATQPGSGARGQGPAAQGSSAAGSGAVRQGSGSGGR